MKFLIRNTSYWMIKNFDLISIILVTCLTWLSRLDLSKSTSIILKEPLPPQAIFSSDFVNDFPNGNLSEAVNKFNKNDLILIYLYSHWDEESMSLRYAIEQLAEVIKDKVPVVAVNCWNNQSDCHNAIKPNRFPQLYALVASTLLIEYKRAFEPSEMFDFVNSLWYPFHYPKTKHEFDNLLKLYDAIFILCLNSQSSHFSSKIRIFHQISSLYKGKGTKQPNIGFVLLGEADALFFELRQSLNLTVNDAILYSMTGTKTKFQGKFVSNNVLNFLNQNAVNSIINKYSPTGIKSLNSQELLRDGVLVLYVYNENAKFLWDNVKSQYNFYSSALQMKKCTSKNDWSFSFTDLMNFKKDVLIGTYLQNYRDNLLCQQYNQAKISSNVTADIFNILTVLNSNRSKHFTDYESDPFVVSSTVMEMEWTCRKHSISSDFYLDKVDYYLESNSLHESLAMDDVVTPICHDHFNRSVHFGELDGSKYPQLLANWGISLSESSLPQIMVVDWKNEIVHHMSSEINQHSLNELISQLTLNNLTLHMRSDEYILPHAFHSHFSSIDLIGLEKELADPESDLVVYYYTPWCAYCSSLTNLLVMLSRYFANYSTIHFVSLNTFSNDLPCKYQSERVPALVLYPRGRKSESIIINISDESISLSSLIRFVLENSGDSNLNLNFPSIHLHDNRQVMCDRVCLVSAHQTIVALHRNFKTTMRQIITRLQNVESRITEACNIVDFDMLRLQVHRSRDWCEYHRRQFHVKYQSRLVFELNSLFRKRLVVTEKIEKLSLLKRGIYNAMQGVSLEKSVEDLARDIFHLAT